MRTIPVLPALLLCLLLLSCSDLSLLSPQASESSSIEVRSLKEGGVVPAGEPITFVVHGGKESKDQLTLDITLTNTSGESVWTSSQSAPLVDEELVLRLPELAVGEYRLKFVLSRASVQAAEKELAFFLVTGSYAVTGISSYPPTIQPDTRILLRAELSYPEGADPYVRWTQDGKLLGKGRVSEGLVQVTWRAPKAEGVYPIQVELFPAAPAGATDFPFTSALALTAKLYISGAAAGSTDALGPKESYYSLFHLDGSLLDASTGETAEAFGTAVSQAAPGGYRLAEGSGIRYPRMVLPLREGALEPCTLTVRLILEETAAGKELLSITGADPRFSLKLTFDGEGHPLALLDLPSQPGIRIPSGAGPLELKQPHRIDLSLFPSSSSLSVLWFLDGLQGSSSSVAAPPAGLPEEGEIVIGGEKAFSGVITELGVYYQDEQKRPSVDPGIFRSVMEGKYGKRLLLAEGFDGLYFPESFSVAPQELLARLAEGALALGPGSSLTLPFFDLNQPTSAETALEIYFAAPLPAGMSATLGWEGEGKAFLEIRPEGKALNPGNAQELAVFAPLTEALKLSLGAERIALQASSGPVTLNLPKPSAKDRWLSVVIRSPARELGVSIDRILVYRKNGS